MTYEPLKNGDEIRVIAPSTFMNKTDDRGQLQRAQGRLGSLGYKVTFGKYIESEFYLHTAKPEQRIEDLHDAYLDKNVKAILAYRGGWSSNDLLPLIDWDIIKSNPKPLIGFSDITALHNAIYAKTGHVGLLGPIFRTLGDNIGWEYTLNHLNALLKCEYPQELKASKEWGVDLEEYGPAPPWKVLSQGEAEGVLLGGNIGTFYLLQGTEYQPKFNEPFIFAIEDSDVTGADTAYWMSRTLESLLQLPGFRDNLRGLIIGRFQRTSQVPEGALESVIEVKRLTNIPVISEVNFGHTIPIVTLPIGGKVKLVADLAAEITIL